MEGPQLTALTPPSWASKLTLLQVSSCFLEIMWILPSAEPAARMSPYSHGAQAIEFTEASASN